eukprot:386940_1
MSRLIHRLRIRNIINTNNHYHHCIKYLSTVAVPESRTVFNSSLHDLNKKHASLLSNSYEYDYFRSEISTRLISRILDLEGSFPKALDFGSHSGTTYKELINFIRQNPTEKVPAGITELYEIETCKELLHRDVIPDWQQQLIKCNKVHIDTFDNPNGDNKLPFDDNTFDIILTGMSLQWINDIPFVFNEIKRILKPDGCFIGAFSGGATLQELRSSLLLADQERKGGMNSHMSPHINISDIGNLLARAGLVMITVDNDVIQIPYPNLFVLCNHLHGMGDQYALQLPHNAKRFDGISKDVFIAAAAIYDELYSNSEQINMETRNELNEYANKNIDQDENNMKDMNDISIDATIQMIYFMCWKPSATQSKPMERGTAQFSMKDLDEITDIVEEQTNNLENQNENDDDKNKNDPNK